MSVTLKITENFFDRPAIQQAIRRAQKDTTRLEKAGAFVRRSARGSIRKVKRKTTVSKPGQAPRSHKNDGGLNLRSIFYSWDPSLQAMIVGPAGFRRLAGGHTVPEVHEEGLSIPVKVYRRNRSRRKSRGTYSEAQRLAFIRLVKARRIIVEENAPITETINYPQRPFMGPALRKELPKFPELWEGSIHS